MNYNDGLYNLAVKKDNTCPKCGKSILEKDSFCAHCGADLGQGVLVSVIRQKKLERHIRNARKVLAIFAVLLIFAGVMMTLSGSEVSEFHETKQNTYQIVGIFYLVFGGFYAFLYYWAKKKPFMAIVIALVIQATGLGATLIVNPMSIISLGTIISIICIIYLIRGVKAGLEYRRIKSPNLHKIM